ncbi:MAG: DUF2155 domain-containing protein [Hyphomonadaceae bacterium]
MIRTLAASLAFAAAAIAPAYAQTAVIRGLDKITGHARDYPLPLGRAVRVNSLEVIARACTKAAPEETPEVRIYVEVYDQAPDNAVEGGERREVFHGWLFASSPGLSAIDHPTSDIWAIDCR